MLIDYETKDLVTRSVLKKNQQALQNACKKFHKKMLILLKNLRILRIHVSYDRYSSVEFDFNFPIPFYGPKFSCKLAPIMNLWSNIDLAILAEFFPYLTNLIMHMYTPDTFKYDMFLRPSVAIPLASSKSLPNIKRITINLWNNRQNWIFPNLKIIKFHASLKNILVPPVPVIEILRESETQSDMFHIRGVQVLIMSDSKKSPLLVQLSYPDGTTTEEFQQKRDRLNYVSILGKTLIMIWNKI